MAQNGSLIIRNIIIHIAFDYYILVNNKKKDITWPLYTEKVLSCYKAKYDHFDSAIFFTKSFFTLPT